MDAKAHRQTGVLEIRHLHLEDQPFAADAVFDALVTALKEFMGFQGCERVAVNRAGPDLRAFISDLKQFS